MPPSTSLVTYLRDLREGRAIGVAETSFYGPLATLLNTIGATLKPRVRCIIHPKGGVTMPGKGRVLARDYSADELEAYEAGAAALGLTSAQIRALLGERTATSTSMASPTGRTYLARSGTTPSAATR
jgi:hypothetical protein